MATQTNTAEMPLHCCLCPRKPDFSDQSHLLTHIHSKGHLAQHYKAKLAASTDATIAQDLADYDLWYETWGVQELMQERMSQKEKKKRALAKTDPPRRISTASASGLSSRNTPAPMAIRALPRPRSSLDPTYQRFKQEQLSRPDSPMGYPMGLHAPIPHRTVAPGLSTWGHGDLLRSQTPMLKEESFGSDDEDEYYEVPHFGFGGPRHLKGSVSLSTNSVPEECEMEATITDPNRMKGTIWPGMANFDSATPEARKKRNQKKQPSVLAHLQATSEQTEPMEWVHDQNFVCQTEREITGNVEATDELIPGESSPEPDRADRARMRRQPRAHHSTTRRVKVERAESVQPKRKQTSNFDQPYFGSSTRRRTLQDDDFHTIDDEIAVANTAQRRRTGISLHRDQSGPEITFDQTPTNYMASTSRHGSYGNINTLSRPPSYGNPTSQAVPRSHQRQPSLNMFDDTFRSPMSYPSYGAPDYPTFGQFVYAANQGQQQGYAGFGNGLPVPQAQASFHQQYSGQSSTNQSQRLPSLSGGYAPQQPSYGFPSYPQPAAFQAAELNVDHPDSLDLLLGYGAGDFAAPGEAPAAAGNPLYRPIKEDDEVTISANGEH